MERQGSWQRVEEELGGDRVLPEAELELELELKLESSSRAAATITRGERGSALSVLRLLNAAREHCARQI